MTQVVSLVVIYSVGAVGLGLAFGEAGLLSLSHAAIMGCGAYAFAALYAITESLALSAVGGVGVAILVSLVAAVASWRLGEVHFALVTFGLQLILSSLFRNLDWVTGGPVGLRGLPTLGAMLGVSGGVGSVLRTATFLLIGMALYGWAIQVREGTGGRLFRGVRDDPKLLASLGKNPQWARTMAIAASGTFAGLAGILYALHIGYIQPKAFDMMSSLMLVGIVVIGGAGSRFGPLIGSLVVLGAPELLRFVGTTTVQVAQVREIVFGALLVICVRVRPKGIVGDVEVI